MKVVVDAHGRRVEVDASADEHKGGLAKMLTHAYALWSMTEQTHKAPGFRVAERAA